MSKSENAAKAAQLAVAAAELIANAVLELSKEEKDALYVNKLLVLDSVTRCVTERLQTGNPLATITRADLTQ